MSKPIDKSGEFVSLVGLGAWKMFPWAEGGASPQEDAAKKAIDEFSKSQTPDRALARTVASSGQTAEKHPPQGFALFKQDKA